MGAQARARAGGGGVLSSTLASRLGAGVGGSLLTPQELRAPGQSHQQVKVALGTAGYSLSEPGAPLC